MIISHSCHQINSDSYLQGFFFLRTIRCQSVNSIHVQAIKLILLQYKEGNVEKDSVSEIKHVHHTKVLFTFKTLRKRSLFCNIKTGLCCYSRSIHLFTHSPVHRNAFQPAKHQTPDDKNLGEGHRVPPSLQRHLLEKNLPASWRGTKRLRQSGSRHLGKIIP